jgi:hypothetical protein
MVAENATRTFFEPHMATNLAHVKLGIHHMVRSLPSMKDVLLSGDLDRAKEKQRRGFLLQRGSLLLGKDHVHMLCVCRVSLHATVLSHSYYGSMSPPLVWESVFLKEIWEISQRDFLRKLYLLELTVGAGAATTT